MNGVELADNTMELARLSCGLDIRVKVLDGEAGEPTASRCASEIFRNASSICTATSEKPGSRLPLSCYPRIVVRDVAETKCRPDRCIYSADRASPQTKSGS